MFLLLRLLPLSTPVFISLLFFVIKIKPEYIFIIIPLLIPIIISTAIVLLYKSFNTNVQHQLKKFTVLYSIIPFLFSVGTILLLMFMNSSVLYLATIIGFMITLTVYYEGILIYLYYPQKYHLGFIENISSFLYILCVILFGIGMYGLIIFINLQYWVAILVMSCVFLLLNAHTLITLRKKSSQLIQETLVLSLIHTQLFATILLLPSNQYVSGLILALLYYNSLIIYKYSIENTLSIKKVIQTLITTSLLLLCLILSAQWT